MEKDVSRYLSWASDQNIAKLRSIQSNYSKKINEVSTELGKIDMTGWQDDVSSKLSGLCTSMKDTYCKTISDEVNTGNLEKLITFVTQLRNECLDYQKIENRACTLKFTKESDRKYYDAKEFKSFSPKGQEEYNDYIAAKSKKNIDLSNKSKEIDNTLLAIKSLEFNKMYEASETSNAPEQTSQAGPFIRVNTPKEQNFYNIIDMFRNGDGIYGHDFATLFDTDSTFGELYELLQVSVEEANEADINFYTLQALIKIENDLYGNIITVDEAKHCAEKFADICYLYDRNLIKSNTALSDVYNALTTGKNSVFSQYTGYGFNIT